MSDNIMLKRPTVGGLDVTDDGTYIIIAFEGVNLFKIRKSDKQLLIQAGVDTDSTI